MNEQRGSDQMGTDYYEQRYQKRVLANLERRANQLGYALRKTSAAGRRIRFWTGRPSQ